MSDAPERIRGSIALLLVVVVGLALRLLGVRFGLPAVYNPDEVAIMSRALALAKGDLNPHNFVYPSFFFYALAGWKTREGARAFYEEWRIELEEGEEVITLEGDIGLVPLP